MKQFLTVLSFELNNYFKNKAYLITTILISILLILGLSIPKFFNGGNMFKSSKTNNSIVIFDKNNTLDNLDEITDCFKDLNIEVETVSSEDEAKNRVNNEDVNSAFIIDSFNNYTYLVCNSNFDDNNQQVYEQAISKIFRSNYLTSKGINAEEMEALFNAKINSNIEILGKDSVSNFGYTYALIFIIYFVIITYGQLIATSITSEKSNRAIEVLVTSVNTNSLIFGKVLAGAIASLIQVGIIISSALLTYKFNGSEWSGQINMLFNIPSNVLICFALFGLIGFIFYSFIFGTLGALVSKTEDVSKSVMPITLTFVTVFMLVMFNLTNVDGTLIKALSYIPFSSPIAMFTRCAMGTVSILEMSLSLIILVLSTLLAGLLASKIYKKATLMYGNPIKLTKALKWIKNKN